MFHNLRVPGLSEQLFLESTPTHLRPKNCDLLPFSASELVLRYRFDGECALGGFEIETGAC